MKINAVIMAGGSGSRLWPLSRSKRPKQFLDLYSEKSMFQETISRLSKFEIDTFVTICNEEHRFFAAHQLSKLDIKSKIILEPNGKNTAPAIALAACESKDSLLLILSADHVIQDSEAFLNSISEAISLAESGKLVTFGVIPDSLTQGMGI